MIAKAKGYIDSSQSGLELKVADHGDSNGGKKRKRNDNGN